MASHVNSSNAIVNNHSKKAKDGTTKKDSQSVKNRLQQELMTLMMSSEEGVSAFPEDDNLFKWVGTIEGPQGTSIAKFIPAVKSFLVNFVNKVYDGLKYKLTLEFSSSYPYEPPIVRFNTPCFHPNVDEHGNICLDILKEKWSALYEVRTILMSIQSLLGEPNNDSPLNVQASEMWSNSAAYKKHLLNHYETVAKKTL